eukprot:1628252-Rhodomonas_salina.2
MTAWARGGPGAGRAERAEHGEQGGRRRPVRAVPRRSLPPRPAWILSLPPATMISGIAETGSGGGTVFGVEPSRLPAIGGL